MISTFFKDKQGHWAIIYWPNVPLWIWIIASVLHRIVLSNHLKNAFSSLALAAILAWAYLEVTTGMSWFRRTLGGIVGAWVVIRLFI